jgi:O-antigen chain-terminating methyltransferase
MGNPIRSFVDTVVRGGAVLLGSKLPETLAVEPFEEWPSPASTDLTTDDLYIAFEDAFRGTPEEIAARQSRYLPWIREAVSASSGLPVLDAGFGRGELLSALRAEGIGVRGVDLNAASCEAMQRQGFEVFCSDVNEYLGQCDEGTLSAVVSNSVIEHMEPGDALRFLGLATRAIGPGGAVIVETNNPECAYALGQFWLDLTHVRPYHALTVSFHLRCLGCTRTSIVYTGPVSRAHRVPGVSAANYQEYVVVGFKGSSAAVQTR